MKVYAVKNACSEFVFYDENGNKIERNSFCEFEIMAGSSIVPMIKFSYMVELVASEEEMKKQLCH